MFVFKKKYKTHQFSQIDEPSTNLRFMKNILVISTNNISNFNYRFIS